MWDDFGPYEEVVAASAFSETLSAQPDVAFLVNHRGVTMARTTNDTLKLALTDMGLQSDAWLNPKRQDVKDLVIAIEDRNIDEMSFAFMLEEGWWSEDFSQFRITKVNIDRGDVSAVNYGANPYTSIAARSREILDDLGHLPAGAKRAALARLSGPEDAAPVTAPPQDPAGIGLDRVSAWLLQHS
jgi:HK97 family phage prohead protease